MIVDPGPGVLLTKRDPFSPQTCWRRRVMHRIRLTLSSATSPGAGLMNFGQRFCFALRLALGGAPQCASSVAIFAVACRSKLCTTWFCRSEPTDAEISTWLEAAIADTVICYTSSYLVCASTEGVKVWRQYLMRWLFLKVEACEEERREGADRRGNHSAAAPPAAGSRRVDRPDGTPPKSPCCSGARLGAGFETAGAEGAAQAAAIQPQADDRQAGADVFQQ